MAHSAILGHVEVPITYSKDEAVGILQDEGVVGAGGAGFPTYLKWQSPPHTLLINGAESEPGYYTDKLLLRDEPEALVDLFEFLHECFGIERTVIAAEDVAKPYMQDLERLADRLHEFSVVYVEPKYAYGQERALCKAALGIEIPGKDMPPQHGVVVNNNETALNMYHALFEEKPVTTKFVSVFGEVGYPHALEVPIGALAGDVLRAYGVDPKDFAHCRLYDGGPVLAEKVGDPMGPDPQHPVQKTTNGLMVVHPDKDRPRNKHYPAPGWEQFHNSIDAPWAPSEIVNIEDQIDRVRIALGSKFWTHGPLDVEVGARVEKDDTLAEPASDGRSIGVHASIPGKVTAITDQHIEIVRIR